MTGIERLRKVSEQARKRGCPIEHCPDVPCKDCWGIMLADIADQIEREQACDGDTVENIRLIVGRIIDDMERHVLGVEGMEDSPVARWARELREALDAGRDPADEREAVAWVREHGGLEAVRKMADIALDVYQRLVDGNAGPDMLKTDADTNDAMMAEIDEAIVKRGKERTTALALLGESVPRVTYERHILKRQRQIDESHAALRRRNERIARMGKTIEFFQLNNSNFRHLLADVAERLGFTRFGDDYEPEDLLDALDRRLMPEGMEWPRFEDGEPVKFGDVVSDGDETGRVYYVTFDTVNPVIIGFTDETPDQDPGTWLEVSVNDGERVQRPIPKVLDADGVEIREGDTLWHVETGEQCKVVGVDSRSVSVDFRVDGDGTKHTGSILPANLTHRAPVLAADGKPLREGEMVWLNERGFKSKLVDRGEPLKVVAFDRNSSVGVLDRDGIALGETSPWWFNPSCLTHERPDSWERLQEDVANASCPDVYCANYHIDTSDTSYEWAMARDIVRRAKALAGVSE